MSQSYSKVTPTLVIEMLESAADIIKTLVDGTTTASDEERQQVRRLMIQMLLNVENVRRNGLDPFANPSANPFDAVEQLFMAGNILGILAGNPAMPSMPRMAFRSMMGSFSQTARMLLQQLKADCEKARLKIETLSKAGESVRATVQPESHN